MSSIEDLSRQYVAINNRALQAAQQVSVASAALGQLQASLNEVRAAATSALGASSSGGMTGNIIQQSSAMMAQVKAMNDALHGLRGMCDAIAQVAVDKHRTLRG